MAGYLGDAKSKLVHHLACKKKECDIYNIDMKHRQYFTPDILEQATNQGFIPCKFCIQH
ncbi:MULTISPECIES: hypothetical protein [Nitrosopumilus]|nr:MULTISPECIES: hypothetical protein [Nitrosopumilus]